MRHADHETRVADLPMDGVVWTADDKQVGTVKAVTPDFFAVDVPLAPDYWLPVGLVTTVGVSAVRLRVPKGELAAYQVKEPAEWAPVIAGLMVAEQAARAEADRHHRSRAAEPTEGTVAVERERV